MRSTHGVTLDVDEEAKQLVQQKREKSQQAKKTSTSSINNENEDKPAASRRTDAALERLPAAYIPSGQRHKQDHQENNKTEDASRSTRIHVTPSPAVAAATTNVSMATNNSLTTAPNSVKPSGRRRPRATRPSTGIDKNIITSLLESRKEELNENSAENNCNSQTNRLAPSSNSTNSNRLNLDGSGDSAYKKMYQDKSCENDQLRRELEEARKKIERLESDLRKRASGEEAEEDRAAGERSEEAGEWG